jgi:peptide-methionine (S)-S-oxide reductase
MAEKILSQIYNLLLNPGTREWERTQLIEARNQLEAGQNYHLALEKLEASLRPLALRGNLSPDLTDFYQELKSGTPIPQKSGDPLMNQRHQESAIFAGGCFWCMVEPFEQRKGILSVRSGYTGGTSSRPTYDQVSSGASGHVEAVEIIFDHRYISYQELLDLYWQLIDPTDANGQFQDRGNQYQTIIFVNSPKQRAAAEASKREIQASARYKKPIVTEIRPAGTFWPAENYHQDFYRKNPQRYRRIQRERKQLQAYQRLGKFFSKHR